MQSGWLDIHRYANFCATFAPLKTPRSLLAWRWSILSLGIELNRQRSSSTERRLFNTIDPRPCRCPGYNRFLCNNYLAIQLLRYYDFDYNTRLFDHANSSDQGLDIWKLIRAAQFASQVRVIVNRGIYVIRNYIKPMVSLMSSGACLAERYTFPWIQISLIYD